MFAKAFAEYNLSLTEPERYDSAIIAIIDNIRTQMCKVEVSL